MESSRALIITYSIRFILNWYSNIPIDIQKFDMIGNLKNQNETVSRWNFLQVWSGPSWNMEYSGDTLMNCLIVWNWPWAIHPWQPPLTCVFIIYCTHARHNARVSGCELAHPIPTPRVTLVLRVWASSSIGECFGEEMYRKTLPKNKNNSGSAGKIILWSDKLCIRTCNGERARATWSDAQ